MSHLRPYYCPVCRSVTDHITGLMGGNSACLECRVTRYCVWEANPADAADGAALDRMIQVAREASLCALCQRGAPSAYLTRRPLRPGEHYATIGRGTICTTSTLIAALILARDSLSCHTAEAIALLRDEEQEDDRNGRRCAGCGTEACRCTRGRRRALLATLDKGDR